jgi:hypothetical protein
MAKRSAVKKILNEARHSVVSIIVVFAVCLALFAGYWLVRRLARDGFLGARFAPKAGGSCGAGKETGVAKCNCV